MSVSVDSNKPSEYRADILEDITKLSAAIAKTKSDIVEQAEHVFGRGPNESKDETVDRIRAQSGSSIQLIQLYKRLDTQNKKLAQLETERNDGLWGEFRYGHRQNTRLLKQEARVVAAREASDAKMDKNFGAFTEGENYAPKGAEKKAIWHASVKRMIPAEVLREKDSMIKHEDGTFSVVSTGETFAFVDYFDKDGNKDGLEVQAIITREAKVEVAA